VSFKKDAFFCDNSFIDDSRALLALNGFKTMTPLLILILLERVGRSKRWNERVEVAIDSMFSKCIDRLAKCRYFGSDTDHMK